jgi:hypothetical protein
VEISFTTKGSFKNTEKFLREMKNINSHIRRVAEAEAQRGVQALIAATPKDSGLAASSWGYKIVQNGRRVQIVWTNNNEENGGFPVAIMLQYGYGTGSGGYVQGRDYINPAMKPLFEKIADNVWKAVKSA